jgi:hypothetical protein
MRFAVETLDDALLKLYPELLSSRHHVSATRGGNTELLGVLIEIEQPRARLSRSEMRGKLYSALGELLWYLTAENRIEFIEKYILQYRKESEDGGLTAYGGYGPRLFNFRGNDQVKNVIDLLRQRPETRRAVVQIFDAEDIAAHHALNSNKRSERSFRFGISPTVYCSFWPLGTIRFFGASRQDGLVPLRPGSPYLQGSTGPLRGARLLVDGDSHSSSRADKLNVILQRLDTTLEVGMQVMEDSICNWQKSPNKFIHFKG